MKPLMSTFMKMARANCFKINALLQKRGGEEGRSETKWFMKELKAANLWGKGQKEKPWIRMSVGVLFLCISGSKH